MTSGQLVLVMVASLIGGVFGSLVVHIFTADQARPVARGHDDGDLDP